ncbi:MAG: AraC family transcriptional regulator [Lachnospiraceae bacterium]|nr:AraC family transcriptional regulator [Lachnospiraceae bacterium]
MERMRATQTIVDDSLRETKVHGTEGFPLGVYLDDFADFENGYICWHWHEEVQVTMIIEGEFTCQVESNELKLKERDIAFINSGLLHQIRPCKLAQGKLYSFIWRGELMGSRGSDIYNECIEPVLNGRLPYIMWDKESPMHDEIAADLEKIVSLYEKKEPAYQLQTTILLAKLWLNIYKQMPMGEAVPHAESGRDKQRVKAALQYMQENYQEQLKLNDIAEAAYISRSELCRSFQRILQMTPMEFLMQYRIRQSTVLLKNKDLRILDIAEMTGFCSPSHFGSYFHKYMGCTPREYRGKI